ncbi:hypothetical protein MPLA_870027 [Mesorhizobium sp. ORS 3359]|nr:hypothetical protein MPLA_870027 [Mesorhizobium sp. ORS 3359]
MAGPVMLSPFLAQMAIDGKDECLFDVTFLNAYDVNA